MANMSDEEITKTTLRIPKRLLKQLKQFGLDNDKSVTDIAIEAFKEFLDRHQRKRK